MQFDSYEGSVPTGYGVWANARLARLALRAIGEESLSGKHILEIGPGRGFFAEACRDAGADYVAAEANSGLVASLRERGFEVIQQTIPPVPAKDRKFDIVFASAVIEHFTPPDAVEVFTGAHNALAKGGRLVLVAPDYSQNGVDFWRAHYTHVLPTTRNTLIQLAQDTGFAVRQCSYMGLMGTFPVPQLAKLIPHRDGKFFRLRLSLLRRIFADFVKKDATSD